MINRNFIGTLLDRAERERQCYGVLASPDRGRSSIHGFHELPCYAKTTHAYFTNMLRDAKSPTISPKNFWHYFDLLHYTLESRGIEFAHYFKINGRDYFVPMVTEEKDVIAGASYGAKLCYETGGIVVSVDQQHPKAVAHTLFFDITESHPKDIIEKEKERLLRKANMGHEHTAAYGLTARELDDGKLVLEIYVNPGNAMGANTSSLMIESIADDVAELIGARYVGNIVSNAYGRLTRAELKVKIPYLSRVDKETGKKWSGEEVCDGILMLYEWGETDTTRAITHNKGLMNGMIAVGLALDQDTRAIDASAHHYASRNGIYKPLSVWHRDGDLLTGRLEIPIPCGFPNLKDKDRWDPSEQDARHIVSVDFSNDPNSSYDTCPQPSLCQWFGIDTADEMAGIMAAAGLATNLSALSMLSTKGVKARNIRNGKPTITIR